MKSQINTVILVMACATIFNLSCKKETSQLKSQGKERSETEVTALQKHAVGPYDLNVELAGADNSDGDIKFRQDPDPEKIVTLDTKIHHLASNHEYLLQRAVDQTIDGSCTGTAWLTLGLGLTPQSISTNGGGNGQETLWRDLSAATSGAVFDIHFRVVDAANEAVVLTSGCYQYTVR